MARQITIPSYSYEDTNNPNIKKFVDRKGDWTHYWLVKERKFVPSVTHVLSTGYSKGPRFRMYLESHTKEEIAKVMSERGDEGSRTHMAIRDILKGLRIKLTTRYPSDLANGRQDPLNDNELENLAAWMQWAQDYNPRTLAFEDTFASDIAAGTLDWLGVITVRSGDKNFEKKWWGQDVLILPDWKTSSAIWSEYEAQTAAYLLMIIGSHKFDKFLAAYAGRIFTGVLRLGTLHQCGYQFEPWEERVAVGEHYQRFLAAKRIADRHEPEFKPVIEQIPTQFHRKVAKAKLPKVAKAKPKTKKSVNKKLPL